MLDQTPDQWTQADLDELAGKLDDPMWRISNLYQIIIKGEEDSSEELVVRFQPNRAQRRLLARLHNRNVILKARQLGMTTLVCILWLDTALFSKQPIRCGIIAQDKEAAEVIFRGKVRFAYERLPLPLREKFPLRKESASELQFAHNDASIRVATSMRSGTIHRLHVSEMGKIAATAPQKAREIVTGSFPAVPQSGMTIVESTAEGQDGAFYDIVERALNLARSGTPLTRRDWRLHFYGWWEEPQYTLDADVTYTEAELEYFLNVEAKIKRTLSEGQRAWYVTTLRNEFAGESPLMWQEYPSYPSEAFQVSTEGCYYATQLAVARKQGRILPTLPVEAAPVNTFWDLGRGDMTTVWFHQRIGPENRFIKYYEATGEEVSHFAQYLQRTGYVFGKHYLPHEAAHKRLGETPDLNRSLKEMFENQLPGQVFEIVPRVTSITAGIQATRNMFASCWFDETACDKGLKRLGAYRKKWDKTRGRWSEEHEHDDNSHAADGFRQFGQAADAGEVFPTGFMAARPSQQGPRRRRSGMAV